MQPDQLVKVFAANVRHRRAELRLSQIALAKRAGIPQPDISDMERGSRSPNLSTIAKLADALEVSPSFLLSGIATPVSVGE